MNAGASAGGVAHALAGWNGILAEAQRTAERTLDEMVWLARLGTVAINAPDPPDRELRPVHFI